MSEQIEWPFEFPGEFGLLPIPKEPVPEGQEGLRKWLDENCPGEDIKLPPVPRFLPPIPVDVRIYVSDVMGHERADEALADFELARRWWRQTPGSGACSAG